MLASVGEREAAFPLPHGRGDEFHHGSSGHDLRDLPTRRAKPRDIYVPDLHLDTIKAYAAIGSVAFSRRKIVPRSSRSSY